MNNEISNIICTTFTFLNKYWLLFFCIAPVFLKWILSWFCACSGSLKFNRCSGREQGQFLRFYAAKCRRWISCKKISLSFYTSAIRNRFVWIIFYSGVGFQFYFTVRSLNLSKSYEFSILIKSRATTWLTLRKRNRTSFKSHYWSLEDKRMATTWKAQTVADLSDLKRSIEVRINFPDVFPWFLLAMKQWLLSKLVHVLSRESALLSSKVRPSKVKFIRDRYVGCSVVIHQKALIGMNAGSW